MNLKKLKQAESLFFIRYPGGFLNPELQIIGKKHRMPQMTALAQESFGKSRFRQQEAVADAMVKMVSRSSLVSLFEKPRFRDLMKTPAIDKAMLVGGLKDFLHGDQQRGLEYMTESLVRAGLAKWSLVSLIPNYYRPNDEVFVKPTTAKGVIEFFDLKGLHYAPRPSWDFYRDFRDQVLDMKSHVDPSLAISNAAFLGFLMMSFRGAVVRA